MVYEVIGQSYIAVALGVVLILAVVVLLVVTVAVVFLRPDVGEVETHFIPPSIRIRRR